MQQRTLGRTSLNVSVLGLGGHTYPVGEGGFCTYEERAQLVARLLEGGVNYFDTTWMNEVELLADSFRRRPPALTPLLIGENGFASDKTLALSCRVFSTPGD